MTSAVMPIPAQERVLPMTGIHNFRDYGGYAARGGKLRRGLLWRSGQHCDATPDDLALVQRVGIATVIDLRGDSERLSYPCLRHDEFNGDVLFHPGETSGARGKAVHEQAAYNVKTEQDAHKAMLRIYTTLPFQPVLVGTFRLYIQALAERESPSLLHCLAGKDRTGVGAALVHTLLGVHHDDLVEDYLLTNTAGDPEARIAAGALHVRSGFGLTMDDAAVRVLMGVDAAFLERSFDSMAQRHGSVEGYARDVLGVTPQRIDAMAERLVEA